MRFFIFCTIVFSLSLSAVADVSKADKKAFARAYKAFQEAEINGSRTEQASTAFKAYQLGKHVYADKPKTLLILANNYGLIERDARKAIPVLQHALELTGEIYGDMSDEYLSSLLQLAEVKSNKEHYFKYHADYTKAKKIIDVKHGLKGPEAARFYLSVGKAAIKKGHRSSITYFKKAATIYDNLNAEEFKGEYALLKFWIGKYHMANRKYKKAADMLNASLNVFEQANPDTQLTMTNHAHLIKVYEELNMRDEATKHCQAIGKAQPINTTDQDYLPVYRRHPKYPRLAQESGKEGYAIVELTVDREGFVKNPKVIEYEGSKSFGTASLDIIDTFRYIPRFENGSPVESTGVRYKFSYNIAK
ncbi:energy transducer TonB [Kordiimonas sp. SCSIO 12603]|uniref:energy transducer TonB n=1 Tax=Kordiimonas sp. SCSIO 12603 TaxID=2829596 RepID=UPI0021032B1D|nr:energy transducer TonB [Kordiimonas sp. SCSIO 12603]UTW57951.1 energy transducer TonB [Kordiimonas sp. SCSIO 12603]